jgi:hypothetical protein
VLDVLPALERIQSDLGSSVFNTLEAARIDRQTDECS